MERVKIFPICCLCIEGATFRATNVTDPGGFGFRLVCGSGFGLCKEEINKQPIFVKEKRLWRQR